MLTDRLAARHMIAQNTAGSIVNIASVAARIALPGAMEYCVSKAGVAMLTHGLALELTPHNIRVNAIGPGFIDTPMTQVLQDDTENHEMMINMTPMGGAWVSRWRWPMLRFILRVMSPVTPPVRRCTPAAACT